MKKFKIIFAVSCILLAFVMGYLLLKDYNEENIYAVRVPSYEDFLRVTKEPIGNDLEYIVSNEKNIKNNIFEKYEFKVVDFEGQDVVFEKTLIEKTEKFQKPKTKSVVKNMSYFLYEGDLDKNEIAILQEYFQMKFGKEVEISKEVYNAEKLEGIKHNDINYYYEGFIFYYKVKITKYNYNNKAVVADSEKEVIIGVPALKIKTEIVD